jgi:hypothetical protein
MKSLNDFIAFMLSDFAPTYVRRYCSSLTSDQWEWFYAQMLTAIDLTDEPEYLFYVLKWILKNDFDDLAYEMYCQDILNPECRRESLIKPSRWSECSSKYHDRFEKDFADLMVAENCVDDCDSVQDLPF